MYGWLAKPLLQRQRGRGRSDLGAVDHEDVSVASALPPFARLRGKSFERGIVIPRRDRLAHALQARVGEIGGVGLDQGIIVGILEHDGDVAGAAELEEFLVAEAFVARLDRVPQANSVECLGEEVDEAGNVLGIELPPRRELPQDRPELWPERGEALGEEIADALRAFAQACPGDAKARALDRELEALGDDLSPRLPARRLLAAVEGCVDLDRRQRPRRIFELLRLGQLVGIEDSAPRRIGPSTDPHPNSPRAHQSSNCRSRCASRSTEKGLAIISNAGATSTWSSALRA